MGLKRPYRTAILDDSRDLESQRGDSLKKF